MKFRTEIDIDRWGRAIGYGDRLFMIGSCFAQSIGEALVRSKFRTAINPMGVLFNPLSVCGAIRRLSAQRHIEMSELREGALGWYHYDFHSSLNGATREEAFDNINEAIDRGGEALRRADWVVVTLGTAWVYHLVESGRVVGNCHREPARNFERRRLSVDAIVEELSAVIEGELSGKRVVLTLSPIRHVADGLAENSLSKATLRLAIEALREAFADRVAYFPAYEIMMDDLRDYRFYASDMVHPSPMAVEYIYGRFCEVAIADEAKALMPSVMRVVKAVEHRPTSPHSEAHRQLCQAQLRAIEQLPEVDFGEEIAYFDGQLKINS